MSINSSFSRSSDISRLYVKLKSHFAAKNIEPNDQIDYDTLNSIIEDISVYG